jgi:hypothetical protein
MFPVASVAGAAQQCVGPLMQDNDPMFMHYFIAFSLGIAIYWYFYTSFIQRIKTHHASIYISLGSPTEMDSNLSVSYNRLWEFLLHFEFIRLGDRCLALFGFGVLGMSLLLLFFFVWSAFRNV